MHNGGFQTDPPPPVLPFLLFPGLLLPTQNVQRILVSSSPRIHPSAASRHWPLQASCPLPAHVLTVPCPSPCPYRQNLEAMARMRALPSLLCSSFFPMQSLPFHSQPLCVPVSAGEGTWHVTSLHALACAGLRWRCPETHRNRKSKKRGGKSTTRTQHHPQMRLPPPNTKGNFAERGTVILWSFKGGGMGGAAALGVFLKTMGHLNHF